MLGGKLWRDKLAAYTYNIIMSLSRKFNTKSSCNVNVHISNKEFVMLSVTRWWCNSRTLSRFVRLAVSRWQGHRHLPVLGVCSNATAPSVSSINRILRNRAAERAAAEFARAAGYGLYAAAGPHPYFNSHQHPTTSHHLPAGWPAPGATGHPWMLPPLATGISGAAASALLLPPSLSPGAAAAAAAAASASAAGTSEHALHAADAIARGYLQGDTWKILVT